MEKHGPVGIHFHLVMSTIVNNSRHLYLCVIKDRKLSVYLIFEHLSTYFAVSQKHFTMFTCARLSALSFLYEKEPLLPDQLTREFSGDMAFYLNIPSYGKTDLIAHTYFCKVIRVNYAYNHIDVRPAYNK